MNSKRTHNRLVTVGLILLLGTICNGDCQPNDQGTTGKNRAAPISLPPVKKVLVQCPSTIRLNLWKGELETTELMEPRFFRNKTKKEDGFYSVRADDPKKVLQRISRIYGSNHGCRAGADAPVGVADMTPNDPLYSNQYYWNVVGGERALGNFWTYFNPFIPQSNWGRGVAVAVVDTGVDYTHPDLTPNMYVNLGEIPGNGVDDDGNGFKDDVVGANTYAPSSSDPMDEHSHGTNVAGIVASATNNNFGIASISGLSAKIIAVNALGPGGGGSWGTIIAGINYSIVARANVINLSLGQTISDPGTIGIVRDAIFQATQRNIVVVAAAGNFAKNVDSGLESDRFYPASFYPYFRALNHPFISVVATDRFGEKVSYSNYGRISSAIGAPAENYTTMLWHSYTTFAGTSAAAPVVSSCIAGLLGMNVSPTDIVPLLLSTATSKSSLAATTVSGGVLNCGLAAEASIPSEWPPKPDFPPYGLPPP